MKNALKAITAIAVFVSFYSAATAQTPTTNTITVQSTATPPATTIRPSGIAAPASTGKAHACSRQYYPKEAIREGLEGTTVLSFTITAQGTVTNTKVASSSGIKILDDASIICAATWLYIPAKQNGQPVDVSWKASIAWSLGRVPLEAEGWTNNCPASLLPNDGSIAPNGRPTSVFFHIATDGSIRDIVVSNSSGSDPLDQLVVKCISQWRYEAPLRNGEPMEMLWGTTIRIPFVAGDKMSRSEFIYSPIEIESSNTCHQPASAEKAAADTVLVLEVQQNGKVTNPRVWQSSESKSLDDYALSCATSLQFRPAIRDRLPVTVTIPVRLAW